MLLLSVASKSRNSSCKQTLVNQKTKGGEKGSESERELNELTIAPVGKGMERKSNS